MSDINDNGTASPFPSASDMDLDLWKASPFVHPDNHTRAVDGVAGAVVCAVYGAEQRDPDRDSTTRRIEMVGDLYEELRKLAERAKAAGLDVSQAEITLSDFVAPKPFPGSTAGD